MIVYLYLCHVLPADDASLPRLLGRLDDEERDRAARFVFDRDRCAYAAAHVLLRRALDLAARPRAWRFTADAFGKPRLEPPCAGIRFSVSHTNGLVAVAVTAGREVGVDVEDAGRDPDEAALSSLALAPMEIADLDDFADRPGRLLQLWVAKEAVAKTIGLGLSLPLQDVVLRDAVPRLVSVPAAFGPVTAWWLQTERYGAHWLALAARPGPCQVKRVEMTVNDL